MHPNGDIWFTDPGYGSLMNYEGHRADTGSPQPFQKEAVYRIDVRQGRLVKLTDEYGDEWPFNIAYVLAYRGDTDRAYEWLQEAKRRNDPGLSEIVSTTEFDNIRADPRWLPYLESIGKAPQQLDAVAFRVTRPE